MGHSVSNQPILQKFPRSPSERTKVM